VLEKKSSANATMSMYAAERGSTSWRNAAIASAGIPKIQLTSPSRKSGSGTLASASENGAMRQEAIK